jgi:hypothetical protein
MKYVYPLLVFHLSVGKVDFAIITKKVWEVDPIRTTSQKSASVAFLKK